MPSSGWTPKITPGVDQSTHLVINRFVWFGSIYCETEIEPDPETISADLTSGQFDDPVRAAAFVKHWAEEGVASLRM
jgi:hypothetical protein